MEYRKIYARVLSDASGKSMQLSATWRCPIDDGVDVCDVAPKQMDDDVCSNAMAGTRLPLLARRMIRARSTSRAAAVRDRASFVMAAFSSSVNSRNLIAIGSLLNRCRFYKKLAGCTT
jgi:hypothetical protein